MNLTNTLATQFFSSDKLKPLGLPIAILMLMVMMVIPLPSILLDVFTSKYDNPRDFNEVVNNLASIGQYPYSYNEARCMFRIKKRNHKPFTPNIGKDGVFES